MGPKKIDEQERKASAGYGRLREEVEKITSAAEEGVGRLRAKAIAIMNGDRRHRGSSDRLPKVSGG